MRKITINKEPVELYKILKFEGLVESGAQAKLVISSGQVAVNGTVETRKRRKIVDGDVIDYNGEQLTVEYEPSSSEPDAL